MLAFLSGQKTTRSDTAPWVPSALQVTLHANIFVSECKRLAEFLERTKSLMDQSQTLSHPSDENSASVDIPSANFGAKRRHGPVASTSG